MTQELLRNHLKAWNRLVRVQQMILHAQEQALKAAGLPLLMWHDVLRALAAAPSQQLRPGEIEAAANIAQYNLSRLLDRMAIAGLVGRQPVSTDGRAQNIVLTALGGEILVRMEVEVAATLKLHLATPLAHDDARKLAKLLGRLLPD